MMKRLIAIAASGVAAAAMLSAAPAFAQATEAQKDAVQARRGYYKAVSINFGALVDIARGKIAYDPATAGVFAANLDLLAKIDVAHLYPEGTSNENFELETRALPKIWADLDGAAKKDDAFEAAAAAMAEAAVTSLAALQGAVGPVSDSCKGCHQDYRAKDF